ncbi:MAG: hypothetical protein QMD09_13060 [Desulfatibacillaceae bacterium]|nr:hypothetical protein [Desulfatibacillaceae bacterium]
MDYKDKSDFIAEDSLSDNSLIKSDPSFVDYLFFHNLIDKFCWLIKLHYSEKDCIKKKLYRIDELFQRFLLKNNVNFEKASKCLCHEPDLTKLEFHLAKGWHNELSRIEPLNNSFLDIGTNKYINRRKLDGTIVWNVIQGYYSFYEFYSCIAVSVNPKIQIKGHKQLSNEINNHTLGKIRNRLSFYPFSLYSTMNKNNLPEHPPHCKFIYSRYPRDDSKDIYELEHDVKSAFNFINNKNIVSIIDVFYGFRLWANYTGLYILLRLSDGGYQFFLINNISLIVFFAGGMAELSTIFSIGESEYINLVKKFTELYINKNEKYSLNKYLVPAFIRLRLYKHLGIISSSINFIEPRTLTPHLNNNLQ